MKSAEQAIMLCKALLLGSKADVEAVCAASSPQAVKRAGRSIVWPADAPRLWNSAVCGIALAVLHQKFADPAPSKYCYRPATLSSPRHRPRTTSGASASRMRAPRRQTAGAAYKILFAGLTEPPTF